MSVRSFVIGGILLAVSFIALTICSSTAFHEFIWEFFTEGFSDLNIPLGGSLSP